MNTGTNLKRTETVSNHEHDTKFWLFNSGYWLKTNNLKEYGKNLKKYLNEIKRNQFVY